MGNYKIKCFKTNEEFEDEYTLHYTDGALIQASYENNFSPINEEGVWRYNCWLPTSKTSKQIAGTITYQAKELGEKIGLTNLWVTFHGYWPEKNAICPTGTFKDMEAVTTIQRMKDHGCKGIICASAGNTARAFAHFCGNDDFPLIVIVGGIHAKRMWKLENSNMNSVKLIIIEDGNYQDAKNIAKEIAKKLEGWQLEGGAHNIARRDGIGSLILNATEKIGKIPEHYFQAVGGGPGPIGVFEMMERLVNSKKYEGGIAKIHLSQNPEHCPIHKAWERKSRNLSEDDFPKNKVEVFSDYLLNDSPAYSILGGVYDILNNSDGHTYAIEKQDAIEAGKIFEKIEGIDILSPSKIALASIIEAKKRETISPNDCILLNISGGGMDRLKKDFQTNIITPWLITKKDNVVHECIKMLNQL